MGGPNRDLKRSQSQTNHQIVLDTKKLTIPNAAREGRVGSTAGSAGGKARGLFGYSTRDVSPTMIGATKGLTGDC